MQASVFTHTPTHSHTHSLSHSRTLTSPPLPLPLTHTPSLWKRRASPNDKVLFAFAHWISLCVVWQERRQHDEARSTTKHIQRRPRMATNPIIMFIMMMTLFDSQSPQKEPSMKPNWTELSHPQHQQWKQLVKQAVGRPATYPIKGTL